MGTFKQEKQYSNTIEQMISVQITVKKKLKVKEN
jgi:hypothetical protein